MYNQRSGKGNPDSRDSNASESVFIFKVTNPHKIYLLPKKYEQQLLAQHSEAFAFSLLK